MFVEFIKSKTFIVLGSLLLLVTLVVWSKTYYKRYQINQQIASLKSEIREVEGKSQEMNELINYLKTSEYKEQQARTLLNLQKPGEFAVALPNREEQAAEQARGQAAQESESNFSKWWRYFFENES